MPGYTFAKNPYAEGHPLNPRKPTEFVYTIEVTTMGGRQGEVFHSTDHVVFSSRKKAQAYIDEKDQSSSTYFIRETPLDWVPIDPEHRDSGS